MTDPLDGIIANWRKQTKEQLIDTLTVYYEGMQELYAARADTAALREAAKALLDWYDSGDSHRWGREAAAALRAAIKEATDD